MPFDVNSTISALWNSTTPLPRISDGDGLLVHFGGGIRAGQVGDAQWSIEPMLLDGSVVRSGSITKAQLVHLSRTVGLQEIAFQSIHWSRGTYSGNWVPITSDSDNLGTAPSDLWHYISSNISLSRVKYLVRSQSFEEIAETIDNHGHDERLAQAIALSLRSMDINVEQISEFYFESLSDSLAAGNWQGTRSGGPMDQSLYAHVQAFFVHLGAARDYLGALVAYRLGLDPTHRRTDSLAGLLDVIEPAQLEADALLALMGELSFIRLRPDRKLAASGWLDEVSKLRNELVHKRPYGQRFLESTGYVVPSDSASGLHRYYRPIVAQDGTVKDVFDEVIRHYRQATQLFQAAARRSGYDHSMVTLTDVDIVSAAISDSP